MPTRTIIINGGSSSGKTAIARSLQDVLPEPWLAVSIDDFVDMLPPSVRDAEAGIVFRDDGGVDVGERFRALETAWTAGIAATVRAGASVIVDDVFLGGAASRRRWADALVGVPVVWVGVRCDPTVAAAREAARGDRVSGMAESQAESVHVGVDYDVEVDTTDRSALDCARIIARVVSGRRGT